MTMIIGLYGDGSILLMGSISKSRPFAAPLQGDVIYEPSQKTMVRVIGTFYDLYMMCM
jgi:hypothetical protein